MVEQTAAKNSEFFVVPDGAKTVIDLIDKNEESQFWLEVSAKKNISADTIQLSFKFPEQDWILGGAVAEYVKIFFSKPDCTPPYKPFS